MARRRRGLRVAAAESSQPTRTLLGDQRLEAEPHQRSLLRSPSELGGAPNEFIIEIQRRSHASRLSSDDDGFDAQGHTLNRNSTTSPSAIT